MCQHILQWPHLQSAQFHAPPEIFVSDGPVGSIVGDWVAERGGVGGVHHIAYQVDDVAAKMKEWQELGFVEFYSNDPHRLRRNKSYSSIFKTLGAYWRYLRVDN